MPWLVWFRGFGTSLQAKKVTSSAPRQGTCLGCGPGPQLGAWERQQIHVSLMHRCFSPFLPLSLKRNKLNLFLKNTLFLLPTNYCKDHIRKKCSQYQCGRGQQTEDRSGGGQAYYHVESRAGRELLTELEPLLTKKMGQKEFDV